MISTRGRYALRVVVDLALVGGDGFTPMKEIAKRQGLSLNYVARIMPLLSKAGVVEGASGVGGGYRLKMPPEECRVLDALRLTDENLAPVNCLGAENCPRRADCLTLPVWEGLKKTVENYLYGITVKDIIERKVKID